MDNLDLRQALDRRLGALKSERSGWESHWQTLADYLLPRRLRLTRDARNPGGNINARIVDNTGTIALRTLASGLMAGVTSPSRPWFRLTPQNRALAEDGEVKAWLYDTESRMREVLAAGNIYNAFHTAYEDLGAFGTAAILLVPDERDIARAWSLPVGAYWTAVGPRGVVDTIYREESLSAAQMVERFGLDACSMPVRNAWERREFDTRFTVLHAIEPRRDRKPGKKDALNKAFRSVWWEPSAEAGKLLREGGLDSFPALVPRWHVTGSDTYGRAPGMDALGDIKQLQVQQQMKGEAIAKMVRPPMVASGMMAANADLALVPGGVSFLPADVGGGFVPAFQVQPRVAELVGDIQETQRRIDRAFYADLFLMLERSDRRQITATEITERRAEKMIALGPVLERLQDEMWNPAIDWLFLRCLDAGILAEPPQAIQEMHLEIELNSSLKREQRADAVISIERLSGFVGNLAAAMPEALHKLDVLQAIDAYAELTGVPPRVVRADGDVEKRLKAQQEAEQAERGLAQVGAGAQAAKVLSEARTEPGSVLGDLVAG